jgi:hypothetical protein
MVSAARLTRPGTFRSSSRTAIHRTASWCDSFTEKSLREPCLRLKASRTALLMDISEETNCGAPSTATRAACARNGISVRRLTQASVTRGAQQWSEAARTSGRAYP